LKSLLKLVVSMPYEPSQWGECKLPLITGPLLGKCEAAYRRLVGELPEVENHTALGQWKKAR
jgi:hypothetical protein